MDGRRDAAFGQPFTPIEDPLEFNSSRLLWRNRSRDLPRRVRSDFRPASEPRCASCSAEPGGLRRASRRRTARQLREAGPDDDDVTRVIVNLGKTSGVHAEIECSGVV